MKKKILISLILLSSILALNAQWILNGDNSSSGNLNIGSDFDLYNGGIIYGRKSTSGFRAWIEPYNTSTGHMKLWNEYEAGDIIFGTANTEKMRINSSGLIGIGTNSPAYKLDVCGTIRAREVKVDLQGDWV